MSEFMSRIALPENADFGHAEVALIYDPALYPVAAAELPGRTDDELSHAAEQGDWGLYETHGIHQDPLPFTALRNRFKDSYRGDAIHEPGGFIKDVLRMQRELPTTDEYAARLAGDGLIRPEEALNVPDYFDKELLKTDEGEDQLRAYLKILYLANAEVPELRTADHARNYASDRIKAASDTGAERRAIQAMREVRGLESGSLEAGRLERLGMPAEYVALLAEAPRSDPFMPRFNAATTFAEKALSSSSLGEQIAYRRLFGMRNLAAAAVANAVVEKPFDSKSLAFSSGAIGMGMAGSLMVSSDLAPDTPFKSAFLDEELAAIVGDPEQLAALGSLATFMMREPALNGPQNHIYPQSRLLGSHVVNMVTANYRIWLDQQIAREARS